MGRLLFALLLAAPVGVGMFAGSPVMHQRLSNERDPTYCVSGRTSKIPVVESYGFDGVRRNMAYEWVTFCERWSY